VYGYGYTQEQYNAYACYKGFQEALYAYCRNLFEPCDYLLNVSCQVGLGKSDILALMGDAGFDASLFSGFISESDLKYELCSLSKKFMVIYWGDQSQTPVVEHAMVVEGYDEDYGEVYYMDPNYSTIQSVPYSGFIWMPAYSGIECYIVSSSLLPTDDFIRKVPVADIQSFQASKENNQVRLDFVLSGANPNEEVAVYVSDNPLGPARLIPNLVGPVVTDPYPFTNTWYHQPLAEGYKYYYFLDAGVSFSLLKPTTSDQVKAAAGNPVYFNNTRVHYGAPSSVTVSDIPYDRGNALGLSWQLSSDDGLIDYYNIYREQYDTVAQGQYVYLASVAPNNSEYVDTAVAPIHEYSYKVSAAHHGGYSGALTYQYGLFNEFSNASSGITGPIDNYASAMLSFPSSVYGKRFCCPAGDGDTLRADYTIKDSNGIPTVGILASKTNLLIYGGDHFTPCNGRDTLFALHGTNENGQTEFAYPFVSACDSITFIGTVVNKCSDNYLGVNVRSADLNTDGIVNLIDLPIFALSYNTTLAGPNAPGKSFNPCCDFNFDNACHLTDFGLFGSHYQHRCANYSQYLASKSAYYSQVELILDDEIVNGTREVTLLLKEASNISDIGIMLDNEMDGMQYLGFTPNPTLNKTIIATSTNNSGKSVVWLAAFGGDDLNGGSIELGKLRYAMSTAYTSLSSSGASACQLHVIYGEALDADNRLSVVRTDVANEDASGPPGADYLRGNYPNPFNPGTYIEYGIAEDSRVDLSIYNASGQLVRALSREEIKKGRYRVYWDGRNDGGRLVSSGLYFCKMRTDKHEITRKLVLIR
jgi:hypothetical protein